MNIDLLTAHGSDRMAWLYCHATLQRLFRDVNDGRNALWSQVPGLKTALSRSQIIGAALPATNIILDHYLLEFDDGWVNVLGGTEIGGWPLHVLSAFEFPTPLTANFLTFWWSVAQNTLADIAAVIPFNDTRKILFSGHSLGGASSVACCYQDYERPNPRERLCVSFGSPKPKIGGSMDGRDFIHVRCYTTDDIVPYLPVNVIGYGTFVAILKLHFVSMAHYGIQFGVNSFGEAFYSLPFSHALPAIVLPFLESTLGAGGPFAGHYMHSYAYYLRRGVERRGITLDPFWDRANAYMNAAEGLEWSIPGFPTQAPPALPVDFTPPAPVNMQSVLDAGNMQAQQATCDLYDPPPGMVVEENQSLAAYLAATTGRPIIRVTVRLARMPLADPTQASFTDFVECDFDGYEPRGEDAWRSAAPAGGNGAKRFGMRVGFSSYSGSNPNTVHHWYVTVTEAGQTTDSLLSFGTFQGGILLNEGGQNIGLYLDYGVQAP